MKKILILIDWFEPAFKAGGPITAALNFVNNMHNDYCVYVLTGDRDLGDRQPMENISVNRWIDRSANVSVFYASPALSIATIRTQVKNIRPDFIYLHSMFSLRYTILPLILLRLGRIRSKVVLAPRGMLRHSAMGHKSWKKKVFLSLFRQLRLAENVVFHATDNTEHSDILKHLKNNSQIFVIPDFPAGQKGKLIFPEKIPGSAKLLFIGRIHPIKNLLFLLDVLAAVSARIELIVVGSVEDPEYWNLCQQQIKILPENISVTMMFELKGNAIDDLRAHTHLFVLPTMGENFGHAIFESLAAGRPILISDQTPWRNLTVSNAGWDIPLKDHQQFVKVISKVANMTQVEFNEWCQGAWDFCNNYLKNSDIKAQYIKLFS